MSSGQRHICVPALSAKLINAPSVVTFLLPNLQSSVGPMIASHNVLFGVPVFFCVYSVREQPNDCWVNKGSRFTLHQCLSHIDFCRHMKDAYRRCMECHMLLVNLDVAAGCAPAKNCIGQLFMSDNTTMWSY